jgi:hypothetical protein
VTLPKTPEARRDEILQIADTPVVGRENIPHKRLRIATRKRFLARLAPRK